MARAGLRLRSVLHLKCSYHFFLQLFWFLCSLESSGTYFEVQIGLQLSSVFLPLFPKYWDDYRLASPCLACSTLCYKPMILTYSQNFIAITIINWFIYLFIRARVSYRLGQPHISSVLKVGFEPMLFLCLLSAGFLDVCYTGQNRVFKSRDSQVYAGQNHVFKVHSRCSSEFIHCRQCFIPFL